MWFVNITQLDASYWLELLCGTVALPQAYKGIQASNLITADAVTISTDKGGKWIATPVKLIEDPFIAIRGTSTISSWVQKNRLDQARLLDVIECSILKKLQSVKLDLP